MKKILLLLFSLAVVSEFAINFYCKTIPCDSTFAKNFKLEFVNKITNFEIKTDHLLKNSHELKDSSNLYDIKKTFNELKIEYANMEFLVGHLYPFDGEIIKGSPTIQEEDGEMYIEKMTTEEGLNGIESILYGQRALDSKQDLINKIRNLRLAILRLKYFSIRANTSDSHILEAIELQKTSNSISNTSKNSFSDL